MFDCIRHRLLGDAIQMYSNRIVPNACHPIPHERAANTERLGNLEALLGEATLAFLPSPSGVRLRISVVGNDRGLCESTIKQIELQIRVKAGKFIYGSDDETLEEMIGKL